MELFLLIFLPKWSYLAQMHPWRRLYIPTEISRHCAFHLCWS